MIRSKFPHSDKCGAALLEIHHSLNGETVGAPVKEPLHLNFVG